MTETTINEAGYCAWCGTYAKGATDCIRGKGCVQEAALHEKMIEALKEEGWKPKGGW